MINIEAGYLMCNDDRIMKNTNRILRNGNLGIGLLTDGSNDTVECPTDASFDFAATDDFSFSLWAKLQTKSSLNRYLFSKLDALTGYSFIINEVSSTTFTLRLIGIRDLSIPNDVVIISETFTLNKARNNHFVFVKSGTDPNDWRLYANGDSLPFTISANTYTAAAMTNASSFEINYLPATGEFSSLYLWRATLYNVAVTEDQAIYMYKYEGAIPTAIAANRAIDLLFDEKMTLSGGSPNALIEDRSGNGNDAELNGFAGNPFYNAYTLVAV
jgi:hypothetical protein